MHHTPSGPVDVIPAYIPVRSEPRSLTPNAQYRPRLWDAVVRPSSRDARPRQERDSLRSRSQEGRPGSRRNKRYTNSQALVRSLHRVMAARGEELPFNILEGSNGLMIDDSLYEPEIRRSAFFLLWEREGPEAALDAWTAAENAPRQAPAKRPSEKHIHQQRDQELRRVFGDIFSFVANDQEVFTLVEQLELQAVQAFSADGELAADCWQFLWNGSSLDIQSGNCPANEIEVVGLDAGLRKIVHRLAEVLGLRSESHVVDPIESLDAVHCKTIVLRPPRTRIDSTGSWKAPFPVAQTLRKISDVRSISQLSNMKPC